VSAGASVEAVQTQLVRQDPPLTKAPPAQSAPGRTRTCDARFRNRNEAVQPVTSLDVWAAQLASLVCPVVGRLGNLRDLIPKIFPRTAFGLTAAGSGIARDRRRSRPTCVAETRAVLVLSRMLPATRSGSPRKGTAPERGKASCNTSIRNPKRGRQPDRICGSPCARVKATGDVEAGSRGGDRRYSGKHSE
jgi:hypothetical protein